MSSTPRLMRLALIGSLAMVTACSNSTATPTPDYVLQPLELMQELIASTGTTMDKYNGKYLEVSGIVDRITRPDGLNETMGISFRETPEKTAFDANLSLFFFDPDHVDTKAYFDGLKPGDSATVTCLFQTIDRARDMFLVKSCRRKS